MASKKKAVAKKLVRPRRIMMVWSESDAGGAAYEIPPDQDTKEYVAENATDDDVVVLTAELKNAQCWTRGGWGAKESSDPVDRQSTYEAPC